MAKKFSELRKAMSAGARAEAGARTERMLAEMALHELRKARKLSQEELAQACNLKQANVSRMEKQTDMYVSSLRRFIEAMGGRLDIVAHFPEGDVRISQFTTIGNEAEESGVS
jgi:transcriptional regulator with XRE-family HTH domain